jgi:hypothetical protein
MDPIEYEAAWVPELVWTFWRREKFIAPTGIRTPDRPACDPVATRIMLLHLQLYNITCTVKLGYNIIVGAKQIALL